MTVTKCDSAYATIRQRILGGDLAPGQVLQQRELATALGISTTPLREALRRLATEGLVELDSHRDARIAALRAEQARDLLEVRLALDPVAASLAAQRRTSADLTELRAALSDLEPLTGRPSTPELAAHRRFHRAVHVAAHNEILLGSRTGCGTRRTATGSSPSTTTSPSRATSRGSTRPSSRRSRPAPRTRRQRSCAATSARASGPGPRDASLSDRRLAQ